MQQEPFRVQLLGLVKGDPEPMPRAEIVAWLRAQGYRVEIDPLTSDGVLMWEMPA